MEMFVGINVNKKHLGKATNEILQEGEVIQAIVAGRVKELASKTKGRHDFFNLDSDKGGSLLSNYLIVTDRRVILWARGAFNSSVDSLDYTDIKSVEQQKGIVFGSIVFNVYGKTEHFSEMNKKEVVILVDMIRKNISKSKQEDHNGKNDTEMSPVTQIEKLASLYKAGILNEEEFLEKKKKLLDLI